MRLLLISSSTVGESGYLDHAMDEIRRVTGGAEEILFLPYALADRVADRFAAEKVSIRSLHRVESPHRAIERAAAIFVGGGNTFVLLRTLYDLQLLELMRARVLAGLPYVGSSAGANIAGVSVQTTNDMPVMFPPSLHALELVPFNVNPHYPDIGHVPPSNGETRDERIREFHVYNDNPVLALRGHAMVEVEDSHYRIRGSSSARLFRAGLEPEDLAPTDVFTPIAMMFERSATP